MVARLIGITLVVGMLTACAFDYYYNVGVSAYSRGSYTDAQTYFLLAAEEGNAPAQYYLGEMYYRGKGVDQDYSEAVRWYRLAAEQGDEKAQNRLGDMYQNGYGVNRDLTEAMRWYELAAVQGHRIARASLYKITVESNSSDIDQRTEVSQVEAVRTNAVLPDTVFPVALLAIECPGFGDGESSLLTEIVRTELFRVGVFDLMERDKMTSMLDEVGFAYSTCTSTQCVIEAGRILSVRYMIAGNIGRIGNTFVINLRAFDVETGRTVATAGKNCRDCAIDDMVETAIPEAVEELAVTITRTGS